MRARQDITIEHQYRSHGNFTEAVSFSRFFQRYFHKIIIS
jgi:hypothetical protein